MSFVYVRFLPVWHKYVHVQVYQRIFSDQAIRRLEAAVFFFLKRSKDENF